ncbi:hypothetical protein K438DRAFT_1798727 [Mycena galopus ATCC 62051]|nr:hypothetical protein K438DRAFT_1798727 [Mycena galopus ATCC 62051]
MRFLPVFFANLDHKAIRNRNLTDDFEKDLDDAAARALPSLHALAHLLETAPNMFPLKIALEFWPRFAEWALFLHDYRDALPVFQSLDLSDPYSTYAIIIRYFLKHSPESVNNTPGIQIIITFAWKVLLNDSKRQELSYKRLSLLLILLDKPILADIVEGAGGSLHDLAALLLHHMKVCTLKPQSSVSPGVLFSLFTGGIITLHTLSDGEGPFNLAVISHGIIKAEVISLCSFLDCEDVRDGFEESVEDPCLNQLLNILVTPPGYTWVRQALQGGLLRGLILQMQRAKGPLKHTEEFFITILPMNTVYYSVLTQLRKSIAEVENLLSSPSFRGSMIFPAFSSFLSITRQRFTIMDHYKSESYISREVCHNLKCAIVQRKQDFLRCSGCQRAYYCSTDCQRTDWHLGRHRDFCGLSDGFTMPEFALGKHDASFLRALVHHDYLAERPRLLVKQALEVLRTNCPNRSIVFNYVGETPGHVYMGGTVTLLGDKEYHISQSRGRIERHLIIIGKGSNGCYISIPMRLGDTHVREELLKICANMPDAQDITDIEMRFPDAHQRIMTLLSMPIIEVH